MTGLRPALVVDPVARQQRAAAFLSCAEVTLRLAGRDDGNIPRHRAGTAARW